MIQFPINPTLNQEYSFNQRSWIWDGVSWNLKPFQETDPIFNASQAKNITPTHITVLNNTSGVNTGDQDLSGLVEKIDGHSLVPDTEIAKLSEYPEFEDLEFSHANLTDKNSEAAFQHVDTTTVKEVLGATDMVAIKDGVTGKFVLSNALNAIAESESSRNQAEITRETNEEERITAEDQRILNEQARVAAGYLTSQEVSKIKRLTQAQYDALDPKDSTTLYLIIQA